MLKRFARVLLEPIAKILRKFFDPRFLKLEYEHAQAYEKLDAVGNAMWTDSHVASVRDEAMRDAITLTHTRITRIESALASQEAYLQDAQGKLDAQQAKFETQQAYLETQQAYLEDQQTKADESGAHILEIRKVIEHLPVVVRKPEKIEEVSNVEAELLNHAESHIGFRSQAGLWFNPPDVVRYEEGRVSLSALTERSIEVPFVLSAVTSSRPVGATVLDIGCSESLIPVELASLGYRVTGIDLREYPLEHPNLQTFATPLELWETDEKFDVVVCLSSIEHFGLGTYGEDPSSQRLDHLAMRMLLDRVSPEGQLVMTIPYGETAVTPVQRMYDEDDLNELLDGWVIDSIDVAEPAKHGWMIVQGTPDPKPLSDPPITRQVALITAHPDA